MQCREPKRLLHSSSEACGTDITPSSKGNLDAAAGEDTEVLFDAMFIFQVESQEA